MTPLMSATANGHLGVILVLLKHGKSNISLKNEWGSTALSIAKRKQYHHIIELLEPLHTNDDRHESPYELLFHHSYNGIANLIKDILSLVLPRSFLDTLTSDKTKDVEDSL